MRTVLPLLMLSAVIPLPGMNFMPDPPAAKVTTIASLPNVDAVNVAVVGRGRFMYLATRKGLVLYDPQSKRSKTIAKEFYAVVTGSPRGDRLAVLRYAENATAADNRLLPWTIAVNPETGEPTGPARRVSMTPAGTLRISPDGKQIALLAQTDPGRIVVLPINGGVERTIAEGRFDAPLRWSPDGKAVYVRRFAEESDQLVRVDVSDGALTEITPKGTSALPGLTPDGKFAIVWESGDYNPARYSVFNSGGKKLGSIDVRVPIIGGDVDNAWSNDGYHWIWLVQTRPVAAYIADYRTGRSRIVRGVTSENLTISPDKSLLFSEEQDPKTGKWFAVLRSADGRTTKVLADMGRGFAAPLSSQWSQDGRYLLYRTNAGRDLMLYDTRTSTSRKLAQAALVGQPHFRSDGKAAVYMAFEAFGEKPTLVARETTLDGKTRVIRDVSADPEAGNAMELIGDSIVYGRRLATVRFSSGPARSLFDVAAAPPAGTPLGRNNSPHFPSLSSDGRWLARKSPDGRAVDVVALDGSARRRIPISVVMHDNLGVKFHPNGREVIVPVKSTADARGGFVAIPLDGGTPRRVVTLGPDESIATYSLSPDGSAIVYSTYGPPKATLWDIDFSPGLPH